MALSLASFRTRFGEFSSVSDALVTARLAEAEVDLDTETFGALFDEAHGFLTAHLLTLSGYGSNAVNKDGTTSYGARIIALRERMGGSIGLVL